MERPPSQVWMVNRRTGPDGLRGWLFLKSDALEFQPDDERAARAEFPLAKIRGVRRVFGSPVLEISFVQPHEFRVMGFYFIKPPSLARDDTSAIIFKKRGAKKQSVVKLRTWNPLKKDEIADWVAAIKAAQRV